MLKNKIVTFITCILIVSMVSSPILLSAASKTYSFSIYYRVNGKTTGNFHSLSTGGVDLVGKAYYTGNAKQGSGDRGETVTYSLYRDKWGADEYIGKVSHSLSDRNNDRTPKKINSTIGKASTKSSKYYLVISKSNNGLHVRGSGELSQ